ncbi:MULTISPECIES: hypothetical protein [unclassified Agromyces]|uniref:hypothetical protein n=1 Tax=unclassified Agromyces TaxID=2639701 RepID=UPI003014BCC9
MDDAADRAPSPLDPPLVIENPTDTELVDAARTGDSFAITRLWQRHLAVAWRAARAVTGRPDAEPVVVRTAELLVAELGEGRGPAGAVRPHLLALTRAAVADEAAGGAPAEPAADGADARPTPGLAPAETYRDLLPDGMGDGSAAAAAFASLPTRWQEALWLAEVDGLAPAEVAAELGLTAEAVDTVLADARSALRTEWSSLRLADLPDEAECRAVAGATSAGRRGRAHLDDCAGCRVVAAPPELVARRAVATLPLLLLGAGGGIAFLESLRPGASGAATEPVPSLAESDAATAEADAEVAAAAAEAATGASAPHLRAVGLAGAFGAAVHGVRRRPGFAVAATLGGIAATTALVAALSGWSGGPGDPSRFLADAGSTTDVAEPAPEVLPPVVVATELPDAPETDAPAPVVPDAVPDASPAPSPTADTAPPPASVDPGGEFDDPAGQPEPPRNGISAPADGGGKTPVSAPAPPTSRAPLEAVLGKPGANGWRTLTVTGEPGSAFTVSSAGELLFSGVLDAGGTAVLQVRGLAGGVQSLGLAYDDAGGTSYALTDETPGSVETARRSGPPSPPSP